MVLLNSFEARQLLEVIIKIGAIAGLFAFVWALAVEFRGFLKIKIKVEKVDEDNEISLFTEVRNPRKFFSKRISNAYLLISLENHEITEVFDNIIRKLHQWLFRFDLCQ